MTENSKHVIKMLRHQQTDWTESDVMRWVPPQIVTAENHESRQQSVTQAISFEPGHSEKNDAPTKKITTASQSDKASFISVRVDELMASLPSLNQDPINYFSFGQESMLLLLEQIPIHVVQEYEKLIVISDSNLAHAILIKLPKSLLIEVVLHQERKEFFPRLDILLRKPSDINLVADELGLIKKLSPNNGELTTQELADYLGVSASAIRQQKRRSKK